ncbi:hypothetical protein [Galactobacter caseinivorans]|uniref:DUF3592 domain-containing protein n=1 Tax=Galactobacter caseinivorans TaxID=2676123 RepID=A0A496PJQ0_9MICC|nr:hypothetical protein [Galactobacter caseinivorans]RKW70721.1 hypothetical protein DWQ67_06330 [Galactobacter caseinivorans]
MAPSQQSRAASLPRPGVSAALVLGLIAVLITGYAVSFGPMLHRATTSFLVVQGTVTSTGLETHRGSSRRSFPTTERYAQLSYADPAGLKKSVGVASPDLKVGESATLWIDPSKDPGRAGHASLEDPSLVPTWMWVTALATALAAGLILGVLAVRWNRRVGPRADPRAGPETGSARPL